MAEDDDGVIIPVSADVDGGSFNTAGKNIEQLTAQLQKLFVLREKMDAKKASGNALTQAEIDQEKKLQAAIDDTYRAMQNQVDALDQQEKAAQKAINANKKLVAEYGRLGRGAMIAGAAILGGMFAAASKYAAVAKDSEQASAAWNFSMMKMDTAANSLGRTMATTLNPALAKTAELFGGLADKVAANPDIGTALLGAGGAAVVAGGALKGTQAAVQTGMISAATGAGIGTMVVAATAVTAGVIASGVAVSWVNYLLQQTSLGGEINAAQARINATGTAYRGVVKPPAPGNAAATIPLTGGLPTGQGDMASLQALERGINPAQMKIQNIVQLANRRLEVQMEADKKLVDAQKAFDAKRISIEAETQKITQSYQLANQQAEQNYQAQRAEIVRSANVASARREEDHQRALQRISRDSLRRIKELAAERDAYGIAQEKQRATDETNEENKNNELEKQRTAQDNAERLRQLDQQYARERAMRLQEYQYNLLAKQAEMTAARTAFEAIQQMAAQMISNLSSYAGASVKTVNAASMAPSGNTVAERQAAMNVTISGGNLTVSQVRQIAIDAASTTVQSTLRKAMMPQ